MDKNIWSNERSSRLDIHKALEAVNIVIGGVSGRQYSGPVIIPVIFSNALLSLSARVNLRLLLQIDNRLMKLTANYL